MGLPLNIMSLDANGGYDTTTRRARCPMGRHWRCSRSRWPRSRPISRRAASPTACSSTWTSSAGGRRRTAAAPTSGRPASRWLSNAARGTMVGNSGLAQLNEDDNLRHTTDFRAVYCSLLEQWLNIDARRSSPTRRRSRVRRWCSDAAARTGRWWPRSSRGRGSGLRPAGWSRRAVGDEDGEEAGQEEDRVQNSPSARRAAPLRSHAPGRRARKAAIESPSGSAPSGGWAEARRDERARPPRRRRATTIPTATRSRTSRPPTRGRSR